MRFASIVVAAGIGIGCCTASAGSQPGEANWVEAQSLRELPAGVQVVLGVGLEPQDDGIADRGEPFNSTDVVIAGVTPPQRRRFALALVGADTVVVAIERGGIGRWVQTVELKQAGSTWETTRCASTSTTPQHGDQLLEALATQPRHDWMTCGLPGTVRPADMPSARRAPMAPIVHR